MSDELKLLPCPFCGGKAKIYQGNQDFLVYESLAFSIFCEKCKCSTQYEPTLKEAINDWNSRV